MSLELTSRSSGEGFKQGCNRKGFKSQWQNVTDGFAWGQEVIAEEGRLAVCAN